MKIESIKIHNYKVFRDVTVSDKWRWENYIFDVFGFFA